MKLSFSVFLVVLAFPLCICPNPIQIRLLTNKHHTSTNQHIELRSPQMLLHCAMVCCATSVGGLDGGGNGENEIRHKFMMPVFHRHKSHGAFQFQFGGAGHLETAANHFLLLGQHHRISRKRKIMPDECDQEKQQHHLNLNLTTTDCAEAKTTVQNAMDTR